MSNNEEIIGILLDNIDKFYVHSKSRSVEKKIIGNLFNDLYRSYKKIQNMIKSNKIHVNTIVPNTPSDIPSTDLLDSHFCIENLKDIVNQQTVKVIVFSCSIKNVKIKIYLNDLTTCQDIHKYTIHHVFSIIDMLLGYSSIKNLKTLNIFLYLTDKEKKLPMSNICVLNKEHVNSAVTYSCSNNGEILVFRKEEWLKCLIHELFHSLCLDFIDLRSDINVKKYLNGLFCIKSDFLLSESYNEWWATNLNCLLNAFMMLEKKSNKKECLSFYHLCLLTEQMFSMLQITKVLNHMGMDYHMLVNKNIDKYIKENLYKEDTNVFCYYIIKGLLLFNNNETFRFFKDNNTSLLNFDKTPQTLTNFLKLIEVYHDDSKVIKLSKRYLEFYRSLDKSDKSIEKFVNTMQMTINTI
jgi:hypothetical protein